MTRSTSERPDAAWRRFVVEHGHDASAHDLAFILQRSIEDISALRATGACSKGSGRKNFVALFQLWHGREPEEGDWPPPRKVRCGEYEWQAPELALLASLVGRLGKAEIAQTLTARLQLLTNDPAACRSAGAVQNAISRIGMQSADVVGGITTADAGKGDRLARDRQPGDPQGRPAAYAGRAPLGHPSRCLDGLEGPPGLSAGRLRSVGHAEEATLDPE